MTASESVVTFECEGHDLVGILHLPKEILSIGVLIVAGAPQYRVGAHRLFVQLARAISAEDWPVLRADRRGYGDNDADCTNFEQAGPDISAAIDQFTKSIPGLHSVVVLGLCDGATAAALQCSDDPRIRGLILINPWTYSEQGRARALLRQHYSQKAGGADNWWKVLKSPVRLFSSLRELLATFWLSSNKRRQAPDGYIGKMLGNLANADHPSLIVLSDDDLTAAEFDITVRDIIGWHRLSASRKVKLRRIREADHTFTVHENLKELETTINLWMEETFSETAYL